jgi:RNA polymerase sigma-70 factor (sigma-E family)
VGPSRAGSLNGTWARAVLHAEAREVDGRTKGAQRIVAVDVTGRRELVLVVLGDRVSGLVHDGLHTTDVGSVPFDTMTRTEVAMSSVKRDEEFAAYVAESRPGLWRTAFLLCGNVAQADDLVQSALLKLYVAWPRLVRGDRIDGYARRIIANSHIDEVRRPWRRETESLEGHEPVAEMTNDDHSALIGALKALPAGQRRVVVLRHYWGLSVAETATDLGISEGSVKSQCAIGLHKLEEALAPHYRSEDRA